MTRKHFEAVARAMRAWQGMLGHKEACEDLAREFQIINPRFDRDKFLTACGAN